jgi:integrase
MDFSKQQTSLLTTQQQTLGLLLTVCKTSLGSLNKPFGLKVLKTLVNNAENIKDFLKQQVNSDTPKKSKVFSRENINQFLEMENDDKKILMKAVLVIGLHGLLRRNELTDLTFEDITRKNEYFEFIIRKSD